MNKKLKYLSIFLLLLIVVFIYGSHVRKYVSSVSQVLPMENKTKKTSETSAVLLAQKRNSYEATIDKSDMVSVVRDVDGDTIVVLLNGVQEKVRLIGINTPETVDPKTSVQCFGLEASAETKKLLDGEQNVILKSDHTQSDRDIYGRLLRYVYLPDGKFLNEILIQEGYAYEYTFKIPYEFQAQFKKDELNAKLAGLGLWASTTCDGKF